MKHFSKEHIQSLDHLYKINLVNSLSGYKSANLIGTKSSEGVSNVAVFSSVTHYGSSPAILGFVVRPTTVKRDTYENIRETGYYTVNSIYQEIVPEAHHTSAKYPKEISEFDQTLLEEEYLNGFYAPFVHLSPVKIAMKYVEEYEIKVNDTILVLGEIQDVYINQSLLEDDGFLNLSIGKIATINGLDGYLIPEKSNRLSYQRPEKERIS